MKDFCGQDYDGVQSCHLDFLNLDCSWLYNPVCLIDPEHILYVHHAILETVIVLVFVLLSSLVQDHSDNHVEATEQILSSLTFLGFLVHGVQ